MVGVARSADRGKKNDVSNNESEHVRKGTGHRGTLEA